MHAFPSPLSFSPAPADPSSLSGGHADRVSHSLSGSVMTCLPRSLWGRQECWCFRLALKGVERALPLLLRPPLPTDPFSARIPTVCLSFFLFFFFAASPLLFIPHSLINVIHWGKAVSVCLSVSFPSCSANGTTSVKDVCCLSSHSLPLFAVLEWKKPFLGNWSC